MASSPQTPVPDRAYPYGHVAWCYDALAQFYSLGAIDRAKAWHTRLIQPGMRVLYLGAGSGREVPSALSRGGSVTCLEPCERMRERFAKRLGDQNREAHLLPLTLDEYTERGDPQYDLVCGNFFFNLFDQAAMWHQLAKAVALLAAGGIIAIADFAPPGQGRFSTTTHNLYYRPVNVVGRALNICALHPIYDYASILNKLGLVKVSWQDMLPLWPSRGLYRVWLAKRVRAD
ncbi:MAG: methyltransferase [Planctomycetota bacterium]